MLRVFLNGVRYDMEMAAIDRRFAQARPRLPFRDLGRVLAVEPQAQGACLRAERGAVELHFVAPDTLRVRAAREVAFGPPFSYAVQEDAAPVAVELVEDDAELVVRSPALICRVRRDPLRLRVERPDGTLISEDSAGLELAGPEVRWSRRLAEEEACYGLGMRAFGLNLRGRRLGLWNEDAHPYSRGVDPMYLSIPFVLGVKRDGAYGILWDNPARGMVDLGLADPRQMVFAAEDGEPRCILFAGPDVAGVLRQYSALAGRMPLPPLWALGFHQSRLSYKQEEVFRSLAREFRQRRLPCDALYFDIDYMDGFRCFSWDHESFPRLPELLADLKEQGFKTVAILDPGIKAEPDFAVDASGLHENIFLKYPDGARVTAPVWPGPCHFPDFTAPRARAWWADQLRVLVEAGFGGFWNDMNEPALMAPRRVRGTLPDYVRHAWEGQGASHVQGGHNLYGQLMARATREGVEQARPGSRPFILSRAGHAGIQRYAATWTGDNASSWDHLRLSISMVLNMALSGVSFVGPDVGGFAGEPDGELFARWMQVGALLPYFRVHSMFNTPAQEPWRFREPVERIVRQALERRYQLLPYLYTAFARCAADGTPIVRPLFTAEPGNPALWGRDDEFLLGDALLAAPVLEPGATRREVYLPPGTWYEYATGQRWDGGQGIAAEAPLDVLPLYVRAGSVIPHWPLMQYVGERPIDELRLRVFAGEGESELYEDAGEGLAYQQGDSCWSRFTCRREALGAIVLRWDREGSFRHPYRQVSVEIIGVGAPQRIEVDGEPLAAWHHSHGAIAFTTHPFAELRYNEDPVTDA